MRMGYFLCFEKGSSVKKQEIKEKEKGFLGMKPIDIS